MNKRMAERIAKGLPPVSEKELAEYDKEFIIDKFGPPTPAALRQLERAMNKLGRPRIGQGAKVISLSIERDLLRRADALAKKRKMTRAAFVSELLRQAVESAHTKKAV